MTVNEQRALAAALTGAVEEQQKAYDLRDEDVVQVLLAMAWGRMQNLGKNAAQKQDWSSRAFHSFELEVLTIRG